MKNTLLLFIMVVILGCSPKEEDSQTYYNKYRVRLNATTNVDGVSFRFTDISGNIISSTLNAPGIEIMYNEKRGGDIIYVNASIPDTNQIAFITCSVLDKETPMFIQSSSYDTSTKVTSNIFRFELP